MFAPVEVRIGPVDVANTVHVARDNHNARGLRGQDLSHEEIGQKEVAEVVCLELAFVTVLGQLVWHRHNASVIDQNVDVRHVSPGIDCLSRFPDVVKREEIEVEWLDLDAWVCCG